MVLTAKLRHQARSLATLSTQQLHVIMLEAQTLDEVLTVWAYDLPVEDRYLMHAIQSNDNIIVNSTIHVYPTAGYAGVWNRYRALRLVINDIILNAASVLDGPDFNAETLAEATSLRIQHLAEELCASVPYVLGLVGTHPIDGQTVITKTPTSLKMTTTATTGSLLCWPLTMSTMVSAIPQHQRYLRDRLLDVSKIVDNGVIEKVAAGFASNLT